LSFFSAFCRQAPIFLTHFLFTQANDLMQAVYTLEGCETAAQVAEEAKRAELLAPVAVVGSIVGSWLVGLAYMLALLFSVQSISAVQG
jgi:amino acid transporter